MPDIVDPITRSRMMAGIRGKNTKPEMLLRGGLHARGLRFRIHVSNLPGKPDLVFPSHRAVLFAHGCFWHGHHCHLFRLPSTRQSFWSDKIGRNRENDAQAIQTLHSSGWRVGVVWECSLRGRGRLELDEVIERCEQWIRSDVASLEVRGKVSAE